MSQISHEEARNLINFNADQVLDNDARSILNAHLDGCIECKSYMSELGEVENVLRGIKHRWDLRPTPLNLDKILSRSKKPSFGFANNPAAAGMAMMFLAVIAVTIGAWQFSRITISSPTATYTAMPVPTPSSHLTSTNAMLPNCDYVSYQVRANDTLNSIASQFSVPKETIMDFNGMEEEKVYPSMQIRIPLCDHTPTVTIKPPSITITITPQFEPITATPG